MNFLEAIKILNEEGGEIRCGDGGWMFLDSDVLAYSVGDIRNIRYNIDGFLADWEYRSKIMTFNEWWDREYPLGCSDRIFNPEEIWNAALKYGVKQL